MRIPRTAAWLALVGFSLCGAATAQSVDVFFGLNALTAQQAQSSIPRFGGGLFPSVGADVMLLHTFGVGAEFTYRQKQNNYANTSARPSYYDVNAIWMPFHLPFLTPEIQIGLGSAHLKAYQNVANCNGAANCFNVAEANHLTGHIGAGLRIYLTHGLFLRPEAHFYYIRHNLTAARTAQRYGISLGYSFGGFLP
ncbi:MAG: hypothetical protein ACYC6M_07845 [Terriglobales bacterium]